MYIKIIPAIKVGDVWVSKYTKFKAIIRGATADTITYETELGNVCTQSRSVFMAEYEHTATILPDTDGSLVHSPQHYQVFPDKEAIEIIASSMTTEQFYGYCLGNFLKYRLRIGAKDEVQQELGKSNKYKELYEKHKHLCK